MAETQTQQSYRYTPSSAQSTRRILDSSPSASTNMDEVPFRPQNHARKSSNYADADARARAAVADTHSPATQKDTMESSWNEKDDGSIVSASASWKPKYGRKQSWNQQDLKRELQMSTVIDTREGPGFSETGKEN